MKKNTLMRKALAIGTSVAMFTCVFAFAGTGVAKAATGENGQPVAEEGHHHQHHGPRDLSHLSTVPVSLVKADSDQPSMAASTLDPVARFGERHGHVGMFINFKPMTIGSITAGVQVLKIKKADGTLEEAKIIASENGYPKTFHFHLDSKTEFVEMTVNVKQAPMGDNDIPVRLKVDWANAKAAPPAPPAPDNQGNANENMEKGKMDNSGKAMNNGTVADKNMKNKMPKEMKKPMSPKTGDDMSVGLFAALGLGSIAAGAGLIRKKEDR